MTSPTPADEALADALADVQARRTRGETPDFVSYRRNLGDSHAEFLALVDTDTLLDEVIEPPAPEVLPRPFGEYTLLRELGRGAVGVVYEAVHRGLRRRAAVKVLRHGFDSDPQARERFRREALASAQVHHDHVVEIYEAGDVDGHPFFAMALVEGRSLASLIRAKEVPPVRALCRELAGVADALQALHTVGIVHRDVKPSNLMVRPDGRMLLADFGLARAADGLALTRSGDALGTPLYMSPEQLLGRRNEIDERADVYALGATLYEAISGKPVFHADDFASLSRLVLSERPTPLRKLVPGCPAAVEAIALKALEKRKEDRYPTAAAMRDDLLAFAQGRDRAVVGHPVSGVVRMLRGASRRWVPIAASLLIAGVGAWWWTHRPATLAVDVAPDAEVFVAGRSYGRAPVSLSLAPGSYDVVFRSPRFVDQQRHVDLSAGMEKSIETTLVPADPNDPVARLQLAAGTNRQLAAIGKRESLGYHSGDRLRSLEDGVFLLPRGNVRMSDVEQISIENFVDDPAVLEFRRGTEVLYAAAFNPQNSSTTLPLPTEVKRVLRVGDEVTWGLRWPKPRGQTATKDAFAKFRLVEVDAAGVLARLEKRTAGLSDELRGEVRVRTLKDDLRLDEAARLEADALADRHPESPGLQYLALEIYRSMKLAESQRAIELAHRIQQFPDAVRHAFENAKLPADAAPTTAPTK